MHAARCLWAWSPWGRSATTQTWAREVRGCWWGRTPLGTASLSTATGAARANWWWWRPCWSCGTSRGTGCCSSRRAQRWVVPPPPPPVCVLGGILGVGVVVKASMTFWGRSFQSLVALSRNEYSWYWVPQLWLQELLVVSLSLTWGWFS